MVGLPLWCLAGVVRLVTGIALTGRDLLAKTRRCAMVQGYVVRGAWCVVRGAWCVVRGAWCVVRGAWCTLLKW